MKHSKLSASGAHRWLACPGSVGLTMDLERKDSDASLEGTKAHELVEKMMKGEPYNDTDYDDDMIGHAQAFIDYVTRIPGTKYSEVQVSYAWVTGIVSIKGEDDSFGTSDCIIIDGNTIHVIDFKYGRGKVQAENNPQLMLYGLGALTRFGIKEATIICHIYQPRIDWVDVWSFYSEDVDDFLDNAWEMARKAFDSIAEPGTNLSTGDHCTWCPARGFCPLLNNELMGLFETANPAVTIEQIKDVLDNKKLIKSWLEATEEYALQIANEGVEIPGWVLKEGRSGNREWIGPVDELLSADVIFKTVPRSVSEVEKILPRKTNQEIWQDLDAYVHRKPAKQVLVPDSTSDFEESE